MELTPESISSLLAGVAGAMLMFSLVAEAREVVRLQAAWHVLPVPPLELASYVVMSLAVAATGPGFGALAVSFLIMPALMFGIRVVWIIGRRTENDPIRRGLEALERRREGRDRG